MPKLHITKYKSIRKSLPPNHTFCTECGEIFPQWFWSTHVMICPMNEQADMDNSVACEEYNYYPIPNKDAK